MTDQSRERFEASDKRLREWAKRTNTLLLPSDHETWLAAEQDMLERVKLELENLLKEYQGPTGCLREMRDRVFGRKRRGRKLGDRSTHETSTRCFTAGQDA